MKEKLLKYFPNLSQQQLDQYELLAKEFLSWNEKINLISRKDTDNIFEHHILHSLAIAKVCKFKPQCEVMDIGTGGGFPGIPLAIMFPETKFYLVDSIGKKIKVVQALVEALGLKNVEAEQIRAENVNQQFDFIVSRAVTYLPDFMQWTKGKISKIQYHDLANGVLYLKGGDLTEELSTIKNKIKIYDIDNYFEEEFFQTKKVIHVKCVK
ncbi:MAG: 16S rRNA (guanine(527)-N(7))-methyltransferase RsmG [Bacteroidales bacterium]|nr:16S rRNA (guanine(527)-N(7))-methyltransferase RsmG [Bacteroidales bacterium]MEE0267733.1 16S rRNA (guanine(527)-N(7))-methyltransferase RsmG [Bacteroidales bacterium]